MQGLLCSESPLVKALFMFTWCFQYTKICSPFSGQLLESLDGIMEQMFCIDSSRFQPVVKTDSNRADGAFLGGTSRGANPGQSQAQWNLKAGLKHSWKPSYVFILVETGGTQR